ncbi:MAG: integration host factor subunit beta [Holosporaceae bacterium]|nr:integration host factor subunit beta [Holosporaceae bacterium]
MTKSELIARISEVYPYLHTDNIEKIVAIITDSIINALKEGGRVELRGFGSFSVRERARSEGRNPRTGEKVIVERKKVPFFKAGRELKNLINGNEILKRELS